MTAPQAFDQVLAASLRALQTVVAPAVDRGNPLAQEQLALVCRFLGFVAQRAPQALARQWMQLQLARELAQALLDTPPGVAPPDLRALTQAGCERAEALLGRGLPGSTELAAEIAHLDACASAWVRCAREAQAQARDRVEALVLRHSARVTALHRAWFAPLGLDPEAATVPPLESLLAARSAS